MNTDYRSFHDRARDPSADANHPLHIARWGHTDKPHGRQEGAPTGHVVCCICWGAARNADDVHTTHRVPGVPDAVEGCCPAHHLRSRYFIETAQESSPTGDGQGATETRRRPAVDD